MTKAFLSINRIIRKRAGLVKNFTTNLFSVNQNWQLRLERGFGWAPDQRSKNRVGCLKKNSRVRIFRWNKNNRTFRKPEHPIRRPGSSTNENENRNREFFLRPFPMRIIRTDHKKFLKKNIWKAIPKQRAWVPQKMPLMLKMNETRWFFRLRSAAKERNLEKNDPFV